MVEVPEEMAGLWVRLDEGPTWAYFASRGGSPWARAVVAVVFGVGPVKCVVVASCPLAQRCCCCCCLRCPPPLYVQGEERAVILGWRTCCLAGSLGHRHRHHHHHLSRWYSPDRNSCPSPGCPRCPSRDAICRIAIFASRQPIGRSFPSIPYWRFRGPTREPEGASLRFEGGLLPSGESRWPRWCLAAPL
mgnify:CR=1 FL=1